MLRLKPYQPGDLYAIEPREYERTLDLYATYDYSETFALGPAFTLFDDDKPVMAGGIVPHWRTRGEAWLRLSPWVRKHPKSAYWWIRNLFADILKEHTELLRIEAPICASIPENLRLVRHLGFEIEGPGPMRKWGPDGSDYIMTVLVRDDAR